MKITKAQLKQIIKEEVESIAGQDVPNEIVYPAIIAGFTEVLNGHLGEQYNFYQELNNIAEYYAKNFEMDEGKKASKTVGPPPYRERGATESQAQQKAAGMALSARRGDTPVSKLKGAALEMYNDKGFTTKEIRNLAKLGQKVKKHKTKEPKHLKSLPGHATPAKD